MSQFGRVKRLVLKLAGRHREANKLRHPIKPRQGWVNRVTGVRTLYFGWYAPLLENADYGPTKQCLDKWGLPSIGWDGARARFSPVLLTRFEYLRLTKFYRGKFLWHLVPIRNRAFKETTGNG